MMIDIVAGLVIALGFYLGYSRGLIKTIFDSLSLLIGIVAALKLSPWVIDLLQSIITTSPAMVYVVGIVITFIAVITLIRFIGRKLEDLLEAVHINFVNKIAGGLLQGLLFAYIISLFLWLLNSIQVLKPETKNASITYSALESLPEKGKVFYTKLKPIFTGFWTKTLEAMESVKKEENPPSNPPE